MADEMTVKKVTGPTHALQVGTPPPGNEKHKALLVQGSAGDVVVYDNGYIVGPEVNLEEMVNLIHLQRDEAQFGGLAMGATEYRAPK